MKNDIKIYKRGEILWLSCCIGGKKYRYPSGHRADRRKFVEKHKEEIFHQKHNKTNDNNYINFPEYGEYILNITSNQRNSFSQSEALAQLRSLAMVFNKKIVDIRPSDIMQWQNSLKLKPATIKNYRSILNMIFEMAYADEIIERNPLKSVKLPKQTKEFPNSYSLKEVNFLIDNADGQFKNVLEFAFFMGMRPGEIIGLKWNDIDFDRSEVKV